MMRSLTTRLAHLEEQAATAHGQARSCSCIQISQESPAGDAITDTPPGALCPHGRPWRTRVVVRYVPQEEQENV